MMLFGFRGPVALQCILLLLLQLVVADKLPNITTTETFATQSECKVCPYELCTSVYVYTADFEDPIKNENITVSCWTHGDNTGGDDGNNVWLYSDKDCYVGQYDLDYSGDAENDLEYCGDDSEEKNITTVPMKLKYHGECDLNPDVIDPEAVTVYYPAGTDIVGTCWTTGATILGNPIYVKTADDCFTGEPMLEDPVDQDEVPNCGPLAFRQINGTGGIDGRSLPPVPKPAEIQPRYLINVTVGEDYAKCHKLPSNDSDTVTAYPFDKHVIVQCISQNLTTTNWFGLTTDFCYANVDDFWEGVVGDYPWMPVCSDFGVP